MINSGRYRLAVYLMLALSSLVLYLPVMSHASRFTVDFGLHIILALKMPDKLEHVSAPLFHAIFLSMHRLMGLSHQDAALAAILLAMVPVPLIAFALFRRCAGEYIAAEVLMAVALGLTIMSPITIWMQKNMIGYVNQMVFHNPTSITLRLFIIPVSILAFRIFQNKPFRSLKHRVYNLLLCAVLVILSMLAKPSFALALLPGCCLFAVWRCLRRENVDWRLLAFGVLLPGLLVLGLLALLSYVEHDDGSSIEFGPLTFMKLYLPTWRIPVQLLLSIVFPVGVSLLYARQASRNLFLSFSWIVFACGIFVTYSLYESGPRLKHGNFLWTGYSAVFLLLFAATRFLLEQYVRELRYGHSSLQVFGLRFSRRFAFASFLFGLHVISGIAYYLRFLATGP